MHAVMIEGEKILRILFTVVALAGVIKIAHAEKHGVLSGDMPTSYRAECSACHVAFPPDLLPADAWRRIMDNLADHYGVDARIDTSPRTEIESFLVRNAGRTLRFRKHGDPLRLTATLWFHRTHGRVKILFNDSQVGSRANCAACHMHADDGRYEDHDLTPLARGN